MASRVLLHIPHASKLIPASEVGTFALSDEALEAELVAMTDAFTDELFRVDGTDRLECSVSRLVVDVERFRSDADEVMAKRGMGATYVETSGGQVLRSIVDRERLLTRYYDPHHARLEAWASEAIDVWGRCLIIDCHSFPSRPLPCDMSQRTPRPDCCVGTDSFHTPREVASAARKSLASNGWTVEVDWPFAGCMVPLARYGTDSRVSSVMIEISRALYMDEMTGHKSSGFGPANEGVSRTLADVIAAWTGLQCVDPSGD